MDELPAGTWTSFASCADSDLTDHGTYVAEVVHDMAPGATLHLICIDSAFDVDSSTTDHRMAYLRTNDIEVANALLRYFVDPEPRRRPGRRRQGRRRRAAATARCGPSRPATKPRRTPACPKGASLQQVNEVGGTGYVDAVDLNPGAGTDRWMSITVGPGDGDPTTAEAWVEMKWDSWGAGSNVDFDIFALTQPTLDADFVVAYSADDQLAGSEPPTEAGLIFSNPFSSARTFYLIVDAWQPTVAPIDIFVGGYIGTIEYPVASGSVAEPGSSPGAFTVGAACVGRTTRSSRSARRVRPSTVG